MPLISDKAIIEAGASIAEDAKIGPFCYIGPNVKIGPGCRIDNNVTIVGNTTIGEQNRLFPMSVVGTSIDSDENGMCIIGNANTIREHVTVYAGTKDNPTTIGRNNLIMIASQVGASANVGDHGIFANSTNIGSATIVEDYVRTSAFSYIDDGITLGAYSFTAGYTHVNRTAPPFAMLQGAPYRVRGANSHNLKACGFGQADIKAIKLAIRDLFNSSHELNTEVLERMKNTPNLNSYVKSMISSLETEESEN